MAKKKYEAKKAGIEELKDELKNVIEEMYSLSVPEVELMTVFRDTFETVHNRQSKVRMYKDALFRMLFSDKKALLSLYNALNNSDYTDPGMLEIRTLDRYWFISVKNDVAFAIMSELYFVEQQSTLCMNMPLRNLFYVAETYRAMVKYDELFRKKLVKILEPRFITFYNGSAGMDEDIQVLRLSDAFERPFPESEDGTYEPELELVVHVYNINKGHNEKLLDSCPILKEYMDFVEVVRSYREKGLDIDMAVVHAIDYCIEHDILSQFLIENRDEVRKVLYGEYTFADYKTKTDIYIEEQTERLREVIEQKNELKEQMEEQERQKDELKEQMEEQERQKDELKEQMEEQERQKDELKEQMEESEKQLQESKEQLRYQERRISGLEAEVKRLSELLNNK